MIYEGHNDVIVAFISSKVSATYCKEDVILTREMPAFWQSGLKRDSVIKLNKLATLDKSFVDGEFGEIYNDFFKEILGRFVEIFSHRITK